IIFRVGAGLDPPPRVWETRLRAPAPALRGAAKAAPTQTAESPGRTARYPRLFLGLGLFSAPDPGLEVAEVLSDSLAELRQFPGAEDQDDDQQDDQQLRDAQ